MRVFLYNPFEQVSTVRWRASLQSPVLRGLTDQRLPLCLPTAAYSVLLNTIVLNQDCLPLKLVVQWLSNLCLVRSLAPVWGKDGTFRYVRSSHPLIVDTSCQWFLHRVSCRNMYIQHDSGCNIRRAQCVSGKHGTRQSEALRWKCTRLSFVVQQGLILQSPWNLLWRWVLCSIEQEA